jgi:hypothetical protein
MRFMSLWRPSPSADLTSERMFKEMNKLVEESTRSGVLVATGGWDPRSPSTVVRNTSGKLAVTDGPYAEAKEVIAGYAILECSSKEHAIEETKKFMKIAGDGVCELRQLGDPPPRG